MSLKLSAAAPKAAEADVLALLVSHEGWAAQAQAQLGGDFGVGLVELAQAEGFEGRPGQQFTAPSFGALSARRVLLLGIGDEALPHDMIKDVGGRAAKAAASTRATSLAVWAAWEGGALGADAARAAALVGEGMALGAYRFDRYMSVKEGETPRRLTSFALLAGDHGAALDGVVARTEALVAGVLLARDLGNEPPQVCTPDYLADAGRRLAEAHGFEAVILDRAQIDAKGMNLLSAVGRGSDIGPRFIHLKYTGAGEIGRRLAFVGKGVTFDTGGYSLKISGSMGGMHLDMCGAAAVFGAAETIGRLAPAGVEIHFIVPTASNMVSAGAFTVNEIIRGYGGKTVEITNTDAEGRLLLADALAYASELGVDEIVDLATLTGACVVALGEQYSGLFSNDDAMAGRITAASKAAGERMWHMPLDAKLRDKLKSPVADMKNACTDRWGGAITAALFLKEWIGDKRWTHLDIAGPAFLENDSPIGQKGASGVGVATLVGYTLGT